MFFCFCGLGLAACSGVSSCLPPKQIALHPRNSPAVGLFHVANVAPHHNGWASHNDTGHQLRRFVITAVTNACRRRNATGRETQRRAVPLVHCAGSSIWLGILVLGRMNEWLVLRSALASGLEEARCRLAAFGPFPNRPVSVVRCEKLPFFSRPLADMGSYLEQRCRMPFPIPIQWQSFGPTIAV